MEVLSKSPEETKKLAERVLKDLSGRNILALKGDLGSGKTTFVTGLGEWLGVSERITSPTFTVVKTYSLEKSGMPFTKLIHVDLYRINTVDQAEDLGLDELWREPTTLVVIEWPDVAAATLPGDQMLTTRFTYVSDRMRKVSW